jgi:hypothetical protein
MVISNALVFSTNPLVLDCGTVTNIHFRGFSWHQNIVDPPYYITRRQLVKLTKLSIKEYGFAYILSFVFIIQPIMYGLYLDASPLQYRKLVVTEY